MTNNNAKTLHAYEGNIDAYIARSPQDVAGGLRVWIDKSLEGLPLGAQILEVGSGSGKDAKYIEEKGYAVERTDATKGFVDYLIKNGYQAKVLDILSDELPINTYDLVLANAVLLHFNFQETVQILQKMYQAIKSGGRFALTVKQGNGEEWSEEKLGVPRFFKYWDEASLKSVVESVGFQIIFLDDDSTGRTNAQWYNVIAKK